MASQKWCSVCRGSDPELFKCGGCSMRFHCECIGLRKKPDASWRCDDCANPVDLSEDEKQRRSAFRAAQRALAERGRRQAMRKRALLRSHAELLAPFVDARRMSALEREASREAPTLERERAAAPAPVVCDGGAPLCPCARGADAAPGHREDEAGGAASAAQEVAQLRPAER